MRRIVTAISAFAMAFSLVAQATPAAAHLPGYESEWRLQTQYETAKAGDTQTTLVQFINTGTTTWTKGTSTQVDLAVCLPKPNDETCDVASPLASWAVNWLSATRYATQTEASVAPGGIANFTYTYKVPAGTAAGFYTLNGDLVVSSIGGAAGRLHPRGYFHQVQVLAEAAASCTPTAITTSPASANNQVGATHTQTATVTCAIPTGGTTAPASVGAQVTFVVDAPSGALNPDLTLTATTDANGVATVTFVRTNPGVDSISAYPTSTPAVRATATKTWSTGAFVIQCTPTAAATQLNATSRTYTVTVRNPDTGAVSSGTNNVTITYVEGTTATPTPTGVTAPTSGSTISTGTDGTGSFSMSGSTVTATPKVAATFSSQAYSATCGATTFEALKATTITVTPDTAATNATNGNRVYTVTAVDQFGAAFTGTGVRFSFTEFTDNSTTTTTTAVINSQVTTAPTGSPSSTCTGTSQNAALTLSSTGTAYVSICATAATTATPIAWNDADGNQVPSTGEAQDTGGTKTWTAAAATSARLSPTSATNAASSETTLARDNSSGEETYSASVRNQSGNLTTLASDGTVTFTVRNTGTSTVAIVDCRGGTASATTSGGTAGTPASPQTIAPAGSATCTATIPAGSTPATATSFATVTIDSNAAGSATVNCTIQVGSSIYACTEATKTWVAQGTIVPDATASSTAASGTVVAFDTTLDYYTISTSVGNFTIYYKPGDTYTVDGTTATYANFESNITLGDTVAFRGSTGSPPAGSSNHALTNK